MFTLKWSAEERSGTRCMVWSPALLVTWRATVSNDALIFSGLCIFYLYMKGVIKVVYRGLSTVHNTAYHPNGREDGALQQSTGSIPKG